MNSILTPPVFREECNHCDVVCLGWSYFLGEVTTPPPKIFLIEYNFS